MSTLKHKTISGIKWTMAASIVQRAIAFGTTVVLARILSPADFGLFALAFVMIDGFGIFKSLGFDSALVRRKDEDIERACNTAFFLIPAMGMILFVILFFFAPIGAKFLNNPQVAPIIRTLALVFVIGTFGKVPQTVLYRNMKFKYKSIAEVSASIVYCVIALTLALNKFGVWSLVIAYIAKTLVQVSIEWYFSGWKPKFEFDRSIAWEMFHFGKYVLGSGVIVFLYSNLDNIVIGKLLGVTMLGYYAISMNLSTFLSQYLLDKVGMIMYPVYSKIQDDINDMRHVFVKSLHFLSILIFPFSACLLLFSKEILLIVFGEKWLPATNALRILIFVGMFRSLASAIWPIFLAKGKSKVDFQIGILQVFIFILLVIPAIKYFKLIGVCSAALISSTIGLTIGFVRVQKILKLSIFPIIKSIKFGLLSSVLMAGICYFLTSSHIFYFTKYSFLFSLIAGLFFYIYLVFHFEKDFISEFKKLII